MDTFMGTRWDDRTARVAFATVFEPGDRIAGALARREGPTVALRMVAGDGPVPNVPGEQASAWRTQARARMREATVLRALAATETLDLTLVLPGDPGWPTELEQLGDRMPQVLWVKGDTTLLSATAGARAAFIGSRAATRYGQDVTTEFASELAQSRVQIVSGGQYGIDATAHRAAVFAGGPTIAVMSGSLDRLYPAGNEDLLRRVAASGGLLLSELPPGTPPTRHRMQQRNRLVAALSDGVLVVEAGFRSSTLLTVQEAAALHRAVGAVPGPINSPSHAGTNWLIQDRAARMILGVHDVRAFLLFGAARLGRRIDVPDPDALSTPPVTRGPQLEPPRR